MTHSSSRSEQYERVKEVLHPISTQASRLGLESNHSCALHISNKFAAIEKYCTYLGLIITVQLWAAMQMRELKKLQYEHTTDYHHYHTPQSSSHSTIIITLHNHHHTPQSSSHSTIIITHHNFHHTPQSSSHSIIIIIHCVC